MAGEQIKASTALRTEEITIFLVVRGAESDTVHAVKETEIANFSDPLNVESMHRTKADAEARRAELAFARTKRTAQIVSAKAKVARQRMEYKRRNPDAVRAAETRAQVALSKHLEAIEKDEIARNLPDVSKLRAAVARAGA